MLKVKLYFVLRKHCHSGHHWLLTPKGKHCICPNSVKLGDMFINILAWLLPDLWIHEISEITFKSTKAVAGVTIFPWIQSLEVYISSVQPLFSPATEFRSREREGISSSDIHLWAPELYESSGLAKAYAKNWWEIWSSDNTFLCGLQHISDFKLHPPCKKR